MAKPKLKDVADAVGVSLTTASLALSGKGRISEEVRNSVEAVALELGYERKPIAPAGKQQKLFGILINMDPSWATVFSLIRPIIVEIEASCVGRGEQVALLPITMESEDEKILAKIDAFRCSGIFSIHFARQSLFDRLEKRGMPVVVIMNGADQDRYSSVLVDDYQGAYEGALHLLKLGHEKIVYVDTDRLGLSVLSSDRFIGFRKALDERKVPFDPQRKIIVPVEDVDYLESRIHSFMASGDPPTAFFALDDQVAVRIAAILGHAGVRVPEDVSILAPGDVMDYNDPAVPRITTMRINTRLMGHLAAEMMAERLDKPENERHVIKIKQQLVQRGSTKSRPGARHAGSADRGMPRARVLAAFDREPGEFVPKWLGASPEFLAKACRELNTDEESFRRLIGDDVRVVRLVGPGANESGAVNPFGIERSGSGYGQPKRHPIQESATIQTLRSYPWPEPEDVDVSSVRRTISALTDEFAIFSGDPSPFWHDAIDLVGMETLSMQMYDDPDFVSTLLARIADYRIGVSTRIFEEAGDLIDVFLIRNDFGGQTGPLIGPPHFERFIVPVLKRFADLAHRFGIKVMMNSAGAIRPLLPLMIGAGIDAVHAMQPDCPGMRPASLKQDFGRDLVLSGTIDARGTLLRGSPDEVRAETRAALDALAPGGGFLASPSVDALTEDVPVRNILALFDEIGAYRVEVRAGAGAYAGMRPAR